MLHFCHLMLWGGEACHRTGCHNIPSLEHAHREEEKEEEEDRGPGAHGDAQEAQRRVAEHDGKPATSFARNIEYYLLTSLALDFSSVDTEADRRL